MKSRRLSSIRQLVLPLVLSCAVACSSGTPAGTREDHPYRDGYRFILYVPRNVKRSVPAPLVVMVHGCQTTAEQQEAASGLDELAERYGFVVLYPDHEGNAALHPRRCWHFATDTSRDSRDPAAIAGMVRAAIARSSPRIDPTRVYYIGMSSGAMLGSVMAATYPDVFAAFMLNAGCAYRATTCIGPPPTRDTAVLAREALAAMGDHRCVVPILVSQGDADQSVLPAHSEQVRDQWRMTDNLVVSGSPEKPLPAAPTNVREVTSKGRYPSTVEEYVDPAGIVMIERWVIHGMGHFWPGGRASVGLAGGTDPKGPNGVEIAWAFFRLHALLGPAAQEAPGRPCQVS